MAGGLIRGLIKRRLERGNDMKVLATDKAPGAIGPYSQ